MKKFLKNLWFKIDYFVVNGVFFWMLELFVILVFIILSPWILIHNARLKKNQTGSS